MAIQFSRLMPFSGIAIFLVLWGAICIGYCIECIIQRKKIEDENTQYFPLANNAENMEQNSSNLILDCDDGDI